MIQKSAILNFPKSLLDRPVISRIIKEFDVEVNILQASITPEEDGRMFAIFRGQGQQVNSALSYLKESGIKVFLPVKNLVWDEDRCVHCTACVGQCPSSAFTVEQETYQVTYDAARCIACELCIPACSYGAVASVSDNLRIRGDV
ncbi:MAG: NIL domain-containing protein [Myxococcota bacterium]|nr:NIL domain-containing protein [Myxococcota bacterium]